MSKIEIKIVENHLEWEEFLSSKKDANFLHSWLWGVFHENLGNKTIRTGFYYGDRLVGVMLSIVEVSRRGKFLIIPGGPLIDFANESLVKSAFDELKKIAQNNNCVFVRVRPQLISNTFSKNLFKKYKFINAPTHLHAELTSQLDITKTEEELLLNMRKATRYEIKKAIKLGIKIETSADISKIKEFYKNQVLTSKRQHFVPFSYDFLYLQFKTFAENESAILLNSYFENKLLAQAFVIYYGTEAVYHYGTGTDFGRKYPGAYLIQWHAILEAKKRGMTRYNFWGVSPENNKSHRFSGISIFKRGFGGEDVEYLHAQDLIVNYSLYLLNFGIEYIRKKIRRL